MKGSKKFEKVIEAYLEKRAMEDLLFMQQLDNPKKNMKDCVKYILNTVKKAGVAGFDDDEIYNMAVHYYDEENIELGADLDATVVINHKVELTEKEIAEAKKKAMDDVINEERNRIKGAGKKTISYDHSKKEPDAPPTLF